MIYEMFFTHNDGSEIISAICCVSMKTILIGERESSVLQWVSIEKSGTLFKFSNPFSHSVVYYYYLLIIQGSEITE